MRFFHTSDWHVGRTIRGRSREDEHHATLAHLLDHAREQEADCLLVAGDVFDTSAPSAEAERLVYDFFRELIGAGIPAVIIAGNHDHPRRFDAIAPLLSSVRVHLVGVPKGPESGGIVEIVSRDGKERGLVAALPWVSERAVVPFAALSEEAGVPLQEYEDQVAGGMQALCAAFRPDTANVLMTHLLTNNAVVGPGGGERELTLTKGIYGVNRDKIPSAAQYVALGHVHKNQAVKTSPPAWYSGSLLQLDFGETEQIKYANLVEVHPRQPAKVERLPITGGRQLIDIGTPAKGVSLNDLPQFAEKYPDAYLRVFIDLDLPVANLTQLVREQLPNAVHIERIRRGGEDEIVMPSTTRLRPDELFRAFYASKGGRGKEPSPETMELFNRLLSEESMDRDRA